MAPLNVSSMKGILLSLLIVTNCTLAILTWTMQKKWSYTYMNNDYPIEAPINNLERVAMTQFEGTHFPLNASDRISDREWRSIYSGPHTMHFGFEQRVFLIALYHETHCLRAMEYTFLHPENAAYEPQHIQHCINYLRQHFLCEADDQLETDDFLKWDLTAGSVYSMGKVCRDWDKVHSAASHNLEIFQSKVK